MEGMDLEKDGSGAASSATNDDLFDDLFHDVEELMTCDDPFDLLGLSPRDGTPVQDDERQQEGPASPVHDFNDSSMISLCPG